MDANHKAPKRREGVVGRLNGGTHGTLRVAARLSSGYRNITIVYLGAKPVLGGFLRERHAKRKTVFDFERENRAVAQLTDLVEEFANL